MEENTEIGERIRILRKSTNVSVEHISQLLDVNTHSWYRWERGQYLDQKIIRSISCAFAEIGFECDLNWLESGVGDAPLSVQKETLDNNRNFTEVAKILREVNRFRLSYPKAIVMVNTSSGFRPKFFPGDYVGGLVVPKKDIHKHDGEYCIVDFNKGPCIRRFQYNKYNYIFHVNEPSMHSVSPVLMKKPPKLFANIIYHRRLENQENSIEEGDCGSFPYDIINT